jgi:hypothetical protein
MSAWSMKRQVPLAKPRPLPSEVSIRTLANATTAYLSANNLTGVVYGRLFDGSVRQA